MGDFDDVTQILALQGEARGVTFLTDARHVKATAGEDGVARVQLELRRLGCPINYGTIKPLDWYPLGWRVLSLVAVKNVFDLDGDDLRSIAAEAPKRSFIIRLLASFFVSPSKIIGRFPDLWEKHYTAGTLVVDELDLQAGVLVFSLWDCAWHPLQCRYQEGYVYRILSLIFPGKMVQVEEVKCMFQGAEAHQYRATWRD